MLPRHCNAVHIVRERCSVINYEECIPRHYICTHRGRSLFCHHKLLCGTLLCHYSCSQWWRKVPRHKLCGAYIYTLCEKGKRIKTLISVDWMFAGKLHVYLLTKARITTGTWDRYTIFFNCCPIRHHPDRYFLFVIWLNVQRKRAGARAHTHTLSVCLSVCLCLSVSLSLSLSLSLTHTHTHTHTRTHERTNARTHTHTQRGIRPPSWSWIRPPGVVWLTMCRVSNTLVTTS